jgi:Ca2+-binding RTX toxin-like protein
VLHKPLSKAVWAVRLCFVLAVVAGAAGAFSLAHQASGAQARAALPVAAPAVQAALVPKGTLLGTAGNDALTAGTTSTVIRAGNGSDTISASNGVRDYIDCGGGLDSVTADRIDELRNCEFVVRVES